LACLSAEHRHEHVQNLKMYHARKCYQKRSWKNERSIMFITCKEMEECIQYSIMRRGRTCSSLHVGSVDRSSSSETTAMVYTRVVSESLKKTSIQSLHNVHETVYIRATKPRAHSTRRTQNVCAALHPSPSASAVINLKTACAHSAFEASTLVGTLRMRCATYCAHINMC
jgi:hypothetical protein